MTEPVVLIDAMNLIFRSHFVFNNLSSEGRPTGVIHGVLKTIADLQENVSRRIVVVWDHGIPILGAAKPRNWRDEFMTTYKATRKHDGDERAKVFGQLPDLAHLINCLGYDNVSVMGLEADDVIGILAAESEDKVCIFSTDQDFYQLLDANDIYVLVPKKDKGIFKKIYQFDVEAEFQISVSRWAEFLALGGDKSDNIKPMRGMGPKTAIKLIQSGVNLEHSFGSQPEAFKQKYGIVWNEIQNAYSAARIPTSQRDPRIRSCLAGGSIIYHSEQRWPSEAQRFASLKYFEEFTADREMTTILSLRRQLFGNRTESKTCEAPKSPNSIPPKPFRVPQRRTLV
jgi:5'-3' exonuclease